MATISVDMSNPRKNPQEVYDPQFLLGTIPVAGSVSSVFDLSSWTQFALQMVPNGTLLGTVLSIYAGQSQTGTFYPIAGTSGVTTSTIQVGSVNGAIISPLPQLTPLRFVEFVAPGTQAAAQVITLLVK